MAKLAEKRSEPPQENILRLSQALNNTFLFYLVDALTDLTRSIMRGDFKNLEFTPEEQHDVLNNLKMLQENVKENLSLLQHGADPDFEEKVLNRLNECNKQYEELMQSETISNETKDSLRHLKLVVSE